MSKEIYKKKTTLFTRRYATISDKRETVFPVPEGISNKQ